MVQKSGDHQLRLVVYAIIYKVLYIPGGASINSMSQHQNRMDPANHKFKMDHFDRKLLVFLEEEPSFEI